MAALTTLQLPAANKGRHLQKVHAEPWTGWPWLCPEGTQYSGQKVASVDPDHAH